MKKYRKELGRFFSLFWDCVFYAFLIGTALDISIELADVIPANVKYTVTAMLIGVSISIILYTLSSPVDDED